CRFCLREHRSNGAAPCSPHERFQCRVCVFLFKLDAAIAVYDRRSMGGTERLSAFLDVSPDLLFYSCARTKSREKPGPDALCHGDPDDDCAVFSWIAVLHYSAI